METVHKFSPLSTSSDIDAYNKRIRQWQRKVSNDLKSSARGKTVKGKINPRVSKTKSGKDFLEKILGNDVRYGSKKDFGEIFAVSFSFPRHGVFMQKGVSRGHPISSPRKAKDWFNSIITRHIPELEEIIADYYADQAVNATQILIQ